MFVWVIFMPPIPGSFKKVSIQRSLGVKPQTGLSLTDLPRLLRDASKAKGGGLDRLAAARKVRYTHHDKNAVY
jgi:hypothetical protein